MEKGGFEGLEIDSEIKKNKIKKEFKYIQLNKFKYL